MKKRILLLLFINSIFTGAIYAQGGVSATWEVLKYDIQAALPQNFSTNRFLNVKAKLNIKNVRDRAFSRLTLRISDKATVSAVQVNNSVADFRKGVEGIGGNRMLQRIIVSVPSIQPNSVFNVIVSYKIEVKANSGLNALSELGSQFLPFSHWYPTPNSWYFSKGGDNAPYSLRVNAPSGETVISSGVSNGSVFEQKLNGQPYFITGKWNTNGVDLSGISVYAPDGGENVAKIKEIKDFALEAKKFVEDIIGKKLGVPIRIVSVNRGGGFADSGTIFVDDSVFAREKLDSKTAMSIVESIAKTYFGNVVKVNGEGYGVIREGMSRFIATRFIEKKFGKEIADIERLRQRTEYSAISTRDAPLMVLSPIVGYYYSAVANKGAIIWKYLSNNLGQSFFQTVGRAATDGKLTMSELRNGFATEKSYLDYMLDKNTTMNLMVGIPRVSGTQTKVALRNISEVVAKVDVVATTQSGKKLITKVTLQPNGFGEAVFTTNNDRVVTAEIDADKIYPQTNYSDDVAPREITDNNALLFIKRELDRKKFSVAEKNARKVLKMYSRFDDAKVLLGRSLSEQSKLVEAKKIFNEVIEGKLPSPQSMARANLGLGQIALKEGRNSAASDFFTKAIKIDAELGASLTSRRERNKIGSPSSIDPSVTSFFGNFDRAVESNRKAAVDALVLAGEVSRFASGVAGQAQKWKSEVLRVERIDATSILVEVNMSVQLLNRQNENGLAVFRLTKVNGGWKLSSVEIFEIG